jgi:hypothetical protein
MKNTLVMVLILGLSLGCSDGKEDGSAGGDTDTDTGTDADDWWEADDTPDDDDDDDKPDDDDDKPDDDDDKPDDDDDKPEDSYILFEFGISLSTGEGGFEGHWGKCNFTGELADVTEVEACDDCSLAMSMTFVSVTFTGEDCEDLDDIEGETESFGHGTAEIFEIEDLSIHALYGFDKDETTTWEAIDGGYSLFYDDYWLFGIEL